MSYIIHIVILLQIYIILALSLNLVSGTTGLLSLAQGAMYGLGAYTSAIISTKFHLDFFTVLPLSLSIGLFAGLIIGFFASRLRGLYFALTTLGFQVVLFSIFQNANLTGGPFGITGIAKPSIGGYIFTAGHDFLIISSFFLALSLLFFFGLGKMPLQRCFECVRDDELGFKSLGKNTKHFKYISLAIAGIFSSIAGSLYASYMTFIDASSFTVDESIIILAICILGGSGTIAGSIAGATIYLIVPEILRFLSLPDHVSTSLRLILFSLLLIIIVRYRPKGLFGKFEI